MIPANRRSARTGARYERFCSRQFTFLTSILIISETGTLKGNSAEMAVGTERLIVSCRRANVDGRQLMQMPTMVIQVLAGAGADCRCPPWRSRSLPTADADVHHGGPGPCDRSLLLLLFPVVANYCVVANSCVDVLYVLE